MADLGQGPVRDSALGQADELLAAWDVRGQQDTARETTRSGDGEIQAPDWPKAARLEPSEPTKLDRHRRRGAERDDLNGKADRSASPNQRAGRISPILIRSLHQCFATDQT